MSNQQGSGQPDSGVYPNVNEEPGNPSLEVSPFEDTYTAEIAREELPLSLRKWAPDAPQGDPQRAPRNPSFAKYPQANRSLDIIVGVNQPQVQIGFQARTIVVMNHTATPWLFCRELGTYLSTNNIGVQQIDVPGGMDTFSFEWHSGQFNTAPPAVVPNQWARVFLYDEWIPPGYGIGTTGVPAGLLTLTPGTTAAAAPLNSTSIAYETNRLIKAGAGNLFGLSGFNSGPAQFIQLHDAAALPANGAIPAVIFFVPAGGNFSVNFDIYGRRFANGIVACNSSTGPTKTIGVADCWFDGQYE